MRVPPPHVSLALQQVRASDWAHEQEAHHLARTLSDGALQDLYAAWLALPDAAWGPALREVAEQLHRALRLMAPPLHEGYPLAEVLLSHARDAYPDWAVEVRDLRPQPLPQAGELCLFRAIGATWASIDPSYVVDSGDPMRVTLSASSPHVSSATLDGALPPAELLHPTLHGFVRAGGFVERPAPRRLVLSLGWDAALDGDSAAHERHSALSLRLSR